MFSNLDASTFLGSVAFYDSQLDIIMSKIVDCYRLMIKDGVALENDENKIRDFILIKYLKNDSIREQINLNDFHFEREVPEDSTIGRTDIKVISANTFLKQAAYYIIECKRIDSINTKGKTGLNGEYIVNGIYRFCSRYYSSFYRTNGMIGFIVNEMDITENIQCINNLLPSFSSINTTSFLSNETLASGFEHAYVSIHLDNERNPIRLYHVMLDFSKNMKVAS